MSLLLRQKTQEALNNIGLTSFHTQINNNKTLEIVTRCGKPFVTIQGIKFNKNSLSLAEIDFASELFTQFLEINKDKIETYITAYTHFHSLPVIEARFENMVCNFSFDSYIEVCSENVVVNYNTKDTFSIRTKFMLSNPDEVFQLLSPAMKGYALNYLNKFIAYKQEEKLLEEAASQLAKCDI